MDTPELTENLFDVRIIFSTIAIRYTLLSTQKICQNRIREMTKDNHLINHMIFKEWEGFASDGNRNGNRKSVRNFYKM